MSPNTAMNYCGTSPDLYIKYASSRVFAPRTRFGPSRTSDHERKGPYDLPCLAE
jgi:hypothetical protein